MLMFKIPGATTLVVSRFNLTGPRTTYNVELLKEDEAMYVFDECKGLPLSLKVLGALLRDKPDRCWKVYCRGYQEVKLLMGLECFLCRRKYAQPRPQNQKLLP
ncbi:hypothetical protein Bca4012_067862 [Brassica carinata]